MIIKTAHPILIGSTYNRQKRKNIFTVGSITFTYRIILLGDSWLLSIMKKKGADITYITMKCLFTMIAIGMT